MKKQTILTMILTATLLSGLFTGCETKKAVETSAPVTNVEKTSTVKKEVTKKLAINVTADKGWDKDSTPAIAHIVSEDKKTDFYHAVSPDKNESKGTSTVELNAGEYTIEFVSPLNKDGSVYEIYDTGKAQIITVEADSKDEIKIECPMKQIPADKVTEEMVKDIVNKTREAVKKGDDTLTGDAGKAVLETLEKNVENSPNASKETKEEVKETAETKTEEKKEAKIEEKKEEKKEETKNNQTSTTQNNNTASQTTSNQTTGSQTATEAPKPQHTHAWKDHVATQQTWVPNIVTIPDYATQTVQTGLAWYCNCGAVITGNSDSHQMNHILAGEPSNGYSSPITETQTVQVGSHTEDHGHYETTSYVDYQYCDCGATR